MFRKGNTNKPKIKIPSCQQNVDKNRFVLDLDSFVTVNFGLNEYNLTANNLTKLKSLGSGSYGLVELREHKASGAIMAVKMMQISEEDKRNLKREIDVLKSSVTCPNVVKFFGAFFCEGNAFICMEAMDTCLSKFYKEVYNKMSMSSMPENVLGAVTVCVLRALNFLKKELNVIHRDVKPSNVLVNSGGEIKMCDFGISGCLVDSRTKSYVGCLKYMAPELFDTERRTSDGYDVRSDVWSLGVTLLEISTGKVPFQEWDTPFMFMDFLTNNSPPTAPTNYSPMFADFISTCLQKDFRDRPKFDRLLEHDYPRLHQNSDGDLRYREFVREVIGYLNS